MPQNKVQRLIPCFNEKWKQEWKEDILYMPPKSVLENHVNAIRMENENKPSKYAYLGAPDMVKWGVPEKCSSDALFLGQ